MLIAPAVAVLGMMGSVLYSHPRGNLPEGRLREIKNHLGDTDQHPTEPEGALAARAPRLLETYEYETPEAEPAGDISTDVHEEPETVRLETELRRYRGSRIKRRVFGRNDWYLVAGSRTVLETLYEAKLEINRQKLRAAALLRYWGIECLIAAIADDEHPYAHVITPMRTHSPPEYAAAVALNARMLRHVTNAKPGVYVPIDYDFVGMVSPAMSENCFYLWVDRPEFIYDLGI